MIVEMTARIDFYVADGEIRITHSNLPDELAKQLVGEILPDFAIEAMDVNS